MKTAHDASKVVRIQLCGILLLISTTIVSISGCAPSVLPHEELAHARQQPRIHSVHYPPRLTFTVFAKEGQKGESIGKYFGPLGLITGAMSDLQEAKTIGENLTLEFGIEDPVILVKAKFTDTLTFKESFSNIRPVNIVTPTEELNELKKSLESGTVIDFKTVTWMMHYSLNDPLRYTLAYQAHFRLIRLDDIKVLWESVCRNRPQDMKAAYTIEELTANQGSLLKAQLQKEADYCANDLLSRFAGDQVSR